MKKKNKAKNPHQIKSEMAHQRNLYLQKIKEMLSIMGYPSAFELLTPLEVKSLYLMKQPPVKIFNATNEKYKVTDHNLKDLNQYITRLLRDKIVPKGVFQKDVSIYDFMTYMETINFHLNALKADSSNSGKYKQQLTSIFNDDYEKFRIAVYQELKIFFVEFSLSCYKSLNDFLWVEWRFYKDDGSDVRKGFLNFIVHIVKPEPLSLEIDGVKRRIFPLGYANGESVGWLTIEPELFGLSHALKPFPVYIQSHAIERVKERLGGRIKSCDTLGILSSVADKDVCLADDGGYLFVYTIGKIKVGYLKADIVGDKLVIRTFLFITNNGTPEGKKLASILGVKKEDKKYLGIDKLDTFIDSDIDQNETLKNIFCEAGCGDLFLLKEKYHKESDKNIFCASFLSDYLCLGQEMAGFEIQTELSESYDQDLQDEISETEPLNL